MNSLAEFIFCISAESNKRCQKVLKVIRTNKGKKKRKRKQRKRQEKLTIQQLIQHEQERILPEVQHSKVRNVQEAKDSRCSAALKVHQTNEQRKRMKKAMKKIMNDNQINYEKQVKEERKEDEEWRWLEEATCDQMAGRGLWKKEMKCGMRLPVVVLYQTNQYYQYQQYHYDVYVTVFTVLVYRL